MTSGQPSHDQQRTRNDVRAREFTAQLAEVARSLAETATEIADRLEHRAALAPLHADALLQQARRTREFAKYQRGEAERWEQTAERLR
jgi:hypothetical protein